MRKSVNQLNLLSGIMMGILAVAQPAWADDCRKPQTRQFADERMGCLINGLAIVHGTNGKYGFIDQTGKIVVPLKYGAGDTPDSGEYYENFPDDMVGFSEGLARVSLGNDHNWGFIDKTGRLVIPHRFYWAFDFYDGLAQVKLSKNSRWQFIDKTGKIVLTVPYEYVSYFSNGRARVTQNGKENYIDKRGRLLGRWKAYNDEDYAY